MALSAGLKAGALGIWAVQDPVQKVVNSSRSRPLHFVPPSSCSTSGFSSLEALSDARLVERHGCRRGYKKQRACQHEVSVSAILAQPKDTEDTEGWRHRSVGNGQADYSAKALNGHAVRTGESSNGAVNGVEPVKHTLQAITAPVAEDMRQMQQNLKSVVGNRHPMLMQAAEQIFGAGGKRIRPALVFLVARATAELARLDDLRPQHRRLAEITEMIHTASLVHDDVLDNSKTRRGKQTVHELLGTRVAVLAGDFLFAQSSWYLANLDNLEVIKLISQVIADFANGEIKQAASLFDCDLTFEDYMNKSYWKTASLIAASAKSAAIFSDVPKAAQEAMFEYGRHLGLAFQVVDDILDFTQTSEQLGKPAGSDLASGNLTAPVLFALKKVPRLVELIGNEFVDEGDLAEAIALVHSGGGIDEARKLARREGDLALQCLECLPECASKHSLQGLVGYVLDRLY